MAAMFQLAFMHSYALLCSCIFSQGKKKRGSAAECPQLFVSSATLKNPAESEKPLSISDTGCKERCSSVGGSTHVLVQ